MNIEDYILIRRIQNGDTEAFETLVQKYYQNIYNFCVRRCNGDTTLAADLTQDTFLKLITHIQQYRLTGKFINFLLTIAVNTCNNHFKKKSPDLVDMDTLSTVESEAVDKMNDDTFRLYLKYHFATCERKDLLGVTSHALDIFKK